MMLFKTKFSKGYIKKYFCGICYFKYEHPLAKLEAEFSHNKGFDCSRFDKEAAEYINNTISLPQKKILPSENILILATEYYDMGGHTELAKNMVQLLSEKYTVFTYMTQKDRTYQHAPTKIKEIEKYSKVLGENFLYLSVEKYLTNSLELIVEKKPKVIFSLIHMDDVFGTALLAMIKRFTDIKVIYINHGSHFPALGFSFADLIWEGMPNTHYITKHFRNIDKCKVLALPDQKKEDIVYHTSEELATVRAEFGIQSNEKFTLSGASSYKFFDNNDEKSEYFEMIKDILEEDTSLHHVVITKLDIKQEKLVDEIFSQSKAKDRLHITSFKTNYSLYFQACDVFIDSFPISSALAQIELMKWKKPTVVKVNKENSIYSFHEYFSSEYPYLFENIQDMKRGVFQLLNDKAEQEKAIEINYQHYLENYEGNVFRDKLIHLIENSDSLSDFYDILDNTLTYNLGIDK